MVIDFKHAHLHQFHVQMDFSGSIVTDKMSILTLTFPDLHYVMLFLVEAPTGEKIIYIFNHLEFQLSTMNKQLRKFFPKGKSIDALSYDELEHINRIINHARFASLSGASPTEVFCTVFGHQTQQLLTYIVIYSRFKHAGNTTRDKL